MLTIMSLSYILFFTSLAASLPNITPSEVTSSPMHLTLQIYRGASTYTPCTGINETLNWPVSNIAFNSSNGCFSPGKHYITCVRRQFQQFDDLKMDTTPKACMMQGYEKEGCEGPASLASQNETAVEWIWNGVDFGFDIQSFRMTCASLDSP